MFAAGLIYGSRGALFGFVLGDATFFVGIFDVLVLPSTLATFLNSSWHAQVRARCEPEAVPPARPGLIGTKVPSLLWALFAWLGERHVEPFVAWKQKPRLVPIDAFEHGGFGGGPFIRAGLDRAEDAAQA